VLGTRNPLLCGAELRALFGATKTVVGPLGIGWARMSGLVTLGTAFTDFLTVVARRGVLPVIPRFQSDDIRGPQSGAL
jgi:hypothetical protein